MLRGAILWKYQANIRENMSVPRELGSILKEGEFKLSDSLLVYFRLCQG